MEIRQTRDTLSQVYKDAVRIRNEVFVKEQGVPFSLEMGSPIDEAASVHFVGYVDSVPVATVRLLVSNEPVILQRMAVVSSERGRGYGKEMLSAVISFAVSHDLTEILLHAQLTAQTFYENYGFQPSGTVFEEAGIAHITMTQTFKKLSTDD